MKFYKFFLINLFLLSSFFYFTQTAQAGLVPCGLTSNVADKCTLCHLFTGIKNIIDWGMKILVVVALVAIVAGGIMYIVSAGNSGMMESAKNVIKQALWGVVIVLGAWLIVNTVMFLIATKADLGISVSSWSDFDCEGGGTGSGGTGGSGTGGGGGTGGGTGTNTCTSFTYSAWAPAICTAGSTQTRTATGVPAGCSGGSPGSISRPCPDSSGEAILPPECQAYEDAFDTASGGDNNLKCLLVGVAMGESACNPSAVNGDGCGIMQIEGGDCDYLIDHPEESISQAAQILESRRAALETYDSTFDIGNDISGSGETVTYGGNTYDTGNDDLIASYNGGTGNREDNGHGLKDPFAVSTDCPVPPTPAWQCHIDAGEFGTATQPYVQNVQRYQNECLGN